MSGHEPTGDDDRVRGVCGNCGPIRGEHDYLSCALAAAAAGEEPGPDEQGRLYAHQLYPAPDAATLFDDVQADDIRRYQVARAVGFYLGTDGNAGGTPRWVGEGKERTFNPAYLEALPYALAELRTAALLVLQGDRDAVAKAMWHFDEMGELSEVVWDGAIALGIDVHKIRPYVDEAS